MDSMEVEQQYELVEKLLKALPKTSNGIASFLSDSGFKGHRGIANACPIAKYLIANEAWSISVRNSHVDIGDRTIINLSPACERFIEEFDNGSWEELVKPGDLGDEVI